MINDSIFTFFEAKDSNENNCLVINGQLWSERSHEVIKRAFYAINCG